MSASDSIAISGRVENITGKTFGRLTVVCYLGRRSQGATWLCRCECGKECQPSLGALKRGRTMSCGCHARDLLARRLTKHGSAVRNEPLAPEYRAWVNMRHRCRNPNWPGYKNYGGRGVSVCERWDSFAAFLEDMGARPTAKHSLDRIDTNGNYEPGNCRWATWSDQMQNRRDSVWLTHDGVNRPVKEWVEITGLPRNTIRRRMKKGLPSCEVLRK
jgi:hypothetical protein